MFGVLWKNCNFVRETKNKRNMKEKIIKAKTCKAVPNKDEEHLRFHTLVDEQLTKIFGDVSAAPEQIGQAWTRMKEAMNRHRLKLTVDNRVQTPQIMEAQKRRDEMLDSVIKMANTWAGDKSDADLQYLGWHLQIYLKRIGVIKHLHSFGSEIHVNLFCHFTLELSEYIAAVQAGKIKPVVEELNQINKEYDEMLRNRFHELWSEVPEDERYLRKQTNIAYRNLIDQTNETLLELTHLTKAEKREQASQLVDIAAAIEDKERITALITLLNDDVSRYELQAAEERQKRKEEAEAKKRRKEQAKN